MADNFADYSFGAAPPTFTEKFSAIPTYSGDSFVADKDLSTGFSDTLSPAFTKSSYLSEPYTMPTTPVERDPYTQPTYTPYKIENAPSQKTPSTFSNIFGTDPGGGAVGGGDSFSEIMRYLNPPSTASGDWRSFMARSPSGGGARRGYAAPPATPTWRTTAIPEYEAPTPYEAPEWDEERFRLETQAELSPHLRETRRMVREAIQKAAGTTNPTLRKHILSGALTSFGDILSKGYAQARQSARRGEEARLAREDIAARTRYGATMTTAQQDYQRRLKEWQLENIRSHAIPPQYSA